MDHSDPRELVTEEQPRVTVVRRHNRRAAVVYRERLVQFDGLRPNATDFVQQSRRRLAVRVVLRGDLAELGHHAVGNEQIERSQTRFQRRRLRTPDGPETD